MSQRRDIHFRTFDDIIEELSSLRRGSRATGNWNLNQTCRHLNIAFTNSMRPGPFPADSAEQKSMSARLDVILASGQLPKGIKAPDVAIPPPDCDDREVDLLIRTIDSVKRFPGPFAPHRIFGTMSDQETKSLMLIHAAHHLSLIHPK